MPVYSTILILKTYFRNAIKSKLVTITMNLQRRPQLGASPSGPPCPPPAHWGSIWARLVACSPFWVPWAQTLGGLSRMKRAKNMECILFGCPQQISLSLRANFGPFVWMPANRNPSPADTLSSCLVKYTGVLRVTHFQTLVSLHNMRDYTTYLKNKSHPNTINSTRMMKSLNLCPPW
jgi:hypothetical protein